MEQISNYLAHMDYVSFGVVALPCVVIVVYGFLQVASGLAKGKNDKMQRCNQSNNNNSSSNNSNNNTSNQNNSNKRCSQKYTGSNNTNNLAMAYQQQQQQHATCNTTSGGLQQSSNGHKNGTRKSRYNKQQHHQQQQQQQQQSFGNVQKRNCGLTGNGSESSSPNNNNNSWGYVHRLVNSSCIEDKFLGQHNPGHRNSTSSEATSEDIESSREHLNRSKAGALLPAGSHQVGQANKSRSKRQQKSRNQQQQQQQQPQQPLSSDPGQKLASKSGKQNGSGKWNRQQNGQQNPAQQQQQHQPKRGNNKKKTNNVSGGNHNNQSHHNNPGKNGVNNPTSSRKHLASTSTDSSSSSSSSSSALSSPTSSPTSSPHVNGNRKRIERSLMPGAALEWRRERERGRQNANFLVPPLRQYEQLDLDDRTLVQQLRRHVIDHHLLRVYGYPVDSVVHDGAIEIFKCLPHMSFAAALAETAPAVTVINCHDGLMQRELESSDSGNSSPHSLDSESGGEWSGSECESSSGSSSSSSSSSSACSNTSAGDLTLAELKYCQYVQVERSLAKPCARCKRHFLVDELTGEYLSQEECLYHSGKYQRYYDGVCMGRWSCCSESDESSPGCCHSERHVWTGSVVGVNGPYYDFVRTQHREEEDQSSSPAVYALDCEMSYTGRGLDVTKVSLVALNGQLVYEHFVRPECDIVDYNTRYSGITERDLRSGGGAKSLAEVQRDLLQLISADTILVGHGLDNDLRALRLVHNTLIDTSISFPHCSGFPYRRALRHLTKVHLKREIQSGDGTTGHSSFEDSRACMELMLWRINRELLEPNWSWDD
ncbi:uncharacterized protein prage isoform X1 [Drosophila kikkawai]|uniref:Uncharacterized protein prage isoform X1 n=2 Tax=Drosophila kikkawai TaxID=30033 RepID=A0A6P4IL50_DROKI|nr:putative uncharacterized protein DDB_G0286901 isoform X2 [Drosophila kikkawai]